MTGDYPIPGQDLPSLVTGHLHRAPIAFEVSDPGGTVPEALRQLILRALAKRPEDRFASAEEFSKLLAGVAAGLAPAARTQERALLDAARQGAQRERAEALEAAEREVRQRLEQGDYLAAREHLSQAVERLGNDTRLAELLRAIESRERDRRQASAENERLATLADAAERALDAGDLPDAMSKLFEILARDPQHVRGRALQERVDRARREQDAAVEGAPTAATLLAGRVAAAPTAAAATPRVVERPAAPLPPAADEVTAPVPVAAPGAGTGAPAPRSAAAALGVAALAVAVAVAGWLLWRALAAPAPPLPPAATATPGARGRRPPRATPTPRASPPSSGATRRRRPAACARRSPPTRPSATATTPGRSTAARSPRSAQSPSAASARPYCARG